jgi:hypothetical protein
MLSNNSKCDSPIEPADPASPPPFSVTDDCNNTGDNLVTVSLLLGINSTLFFIGDLFFRRGLAFSIIRSAVFILMGLALGIIAQKKFKPLKYPTWPKACIIANAVCMVFVIIVSFFHLMR